MKSEKNSLIFIRLVSPRGLIDAILIKKITPFKSVSNLTSRKWLTVVIFLKWQSWMIMDDHGLSTMIMDYNGLS